SSSAETTKYKVHTGAVNCLAFSRDGTTLASGGSDKTVQLQEVRSDLEAHKGHVWSLAFSRDGKILATGGQDGKICFWDIAKASLLDSWTASSTMIRSVVFSPV